MYSYYESEMAKDLKNLRRALVVGIMRSGVAAANFLASRGVAVTASDCKSSDELGVMIRELHPSVRVIAGPQDPMLLDEGFDALVLSPGVPRSIPLVSEALRRGIPVVAEVELAYHFLEGIIVGITGTDGKSTTTAMAGYVMRALGMDVRVGGNIGIPLVSFTGMTNRDTVIVAELSSFQLESIKSFRPDVAALLNIAPDHLDRYDSMEDYVAAKMRIALNQRDDDYFIYNHDDPMTREAADRVRSRALSFSLVDKNADIYFHDGSVYLKEEKKRVLSKHNMRIRGLHNIQNAMVSVLAARSVMLKKGIMPDYDAIAEAVHGFPGLEHRLETVGHFMGREFINDSKATTVNAVLTALKSMDKPTVLILGGRTKGDDYARLSSALDGKVRALVLIGESKQEFARIFARHRHVFADSLDEAVALAMRESREGDAILLSPACASFDMFTNYEERGEEFRQSFRRLSEGRMQWT